ncbi:5-carboxymethyl-2-hydroxymuconate Delta-isomerase [Aquimarina gracilis]|uniref:5-carboxymethyl-2-hydroxymuconate Delta-isomerase n=1 Tax=Aquimarina gracilis TaxID=874422 RepID=A0ABU5ZRN1_9FLAO|nr:5-carboxymethyl-2-hydroxymuconate Delta-isomerase [Aquimarina gracilis]MEB3344451.1 5-carboxymethyl-2-hydroxymuconate Delta-isomerase [Aquimarina gracilis]
MPHFILDCSEHIIEIKSPVEIIQAVYKAAESTELFAEGDIKVRINPFKYYTIGNTQDDFIHVFGNIMEGRNEDQKANLSREIVSTLKSMFPEVPILSMNIREFEKSTYIKKSMV